MRMIFCEFFTKLSKDARTSAYSGRTPGQKPRRLGLCLVMLQLYSSEKLVKESFYILEPAADHVARGAGRAAVGAGLALEVMACRVDCLALRYSFAANRAHLIAGVAGLGAGRLDRVAQLGLMAEGAYIVFRVGLAAGACVGRVALVGAVTVSTKSWVCASRSPQREQTPFL